MRPNYALVMEDLGFCTAGDQLDGMPERLVLTTARINGQVTGSVLEQRCFEIAAVDARHLAIVETF